MKIMMELMMILFLMNFRLQQKNSKNEKDTHENLATEGLKSYNKKLDSWEENGYYIEEINKIKEDDNSNSSLDLSSCFRFSSSFDGNRFSFPFFLVFFLVN